MSIVDRQGEIAHLESLWQRESAVLGLLFGRRRIGKTFLLQHFVEGKRSVYYLAAETTAAGNLVEFVAEINRSLRLDEPLHAEDYPSWRTILRELFLLAHDEPLAVVIDEFGLLTAAAPDLAAQILSVWDQYHRASRLKLLLCGSQLSVMNALDDRGAPLHGRFDWKFRLEPFTYWQALEFHHDRSVIRGEDRLNLYGVLGGSPRFLAQVDYRRSFADNVIDLVLNPLGPVAAEADALVRQEGVRDATSYNAVMSAIAGGATDRSEIINQTQLPGGTVDYALRQLEELGWVTREQPLAERGARRSIIMLADNFLKFWYRYPFRLRSTLAMNDPRRVWNDLIAADLRTYMGRFVFEGICHQYLVLARERLGLPMFRELGRWWSRDHQVEFDIAALCADDSLLVAECKWSSRPVGVDALALLADRLQRTGRGDWLGKRHRLALFSSAGFTEDLARRREEGEVILVSLEDLLAPPGAAG